MTYKFVTREEIKNVMEALASVRDEGLLFWCGKAAGLLERLLAERDAYREVAHSLLWSDTDNHPICAGGCVHEHIPECELKTIDAEAARLLERK